MLSLYERLNIPDDDRLTSIRRDQAEFIHQFLRTNEIKRTAETGFAYGCSAAHIISATRSEHIAIDPYEAAYRNLGLSNLESLGLLKYLRLIPEPSHLALPQLLRERTRLGFAFVDGGHKYDEVFLDWCYFDLLLEQGGYIFFDDTWLPSTQRVCAFVKNNREDYRIVWTPIRNLTAFQKIGTDARSWNHFVDF